MNSIPEYILSGKFKINVDTVEFTIPGGKTNLREVSRVTVIAADGSVIHSRTNRQRVEGADSNYVLHVRQKTNASTGDAELFVEGPLSANRYGQNVWSSGGVNLTCISAVRRLIKTLDIQASLETKAAWLDGHIHLHRVDLAVNFRLASAKQVEEAISQIKHLFAASGQQCSLHQRYAAWCPKSSKHYRIAIYDKGSQLRIQASRRRIRKHYERLRAECDSLLRVEIRLRRPELKQLKLTLARDWTVDGAREVFREYFSRLPLYDVAFGPLTAADFVNISERMRPVLALHRLGADSTLVYSQKSRQRHKKYFKEKGIALDCPTVPEPGISLVQVLSRKGAIAGTPRWLIEAGMAPTRKKKPASQ